jgi:pimeloyl-ACP methyl ester carboxylesterase
VPGYYLYSERHDLVPKRDIRELASRFRQKRHLLQFLPVAEGGHFFPLTKPELAAQMVAELIR